MTTTPAAPGPAAPPGTPPAPAPAAFPPWTHLVGYVLVLVAAAGEVLAATRDGADSQPAAATGFLLACLLVAAVGVAVRRTHPWVLPVAGIAASIVGQSTLLALGCFAYALRRRDRSALVLGVVAALALALPWSSDPSLVVLDGSRPSPVTVTGAIVWAVRVVGVVVLPLLAGGYLAARREILASYRDRAERSEREHQLLATRAVLTERERIAREMHDVLGHQLALASMQAGALEVGAADEASRAGARTLRETLRAAIADLRTVVHALDDEAAPTGAVASGALAADGGPTRTIADLVASDRASGASVTYLDATRGALATDPPGPPVARAALRVAREALTNAYRHAPGSLVDVAVTGAPGGTLTLTIASAAPAAHSDGTGTGLAGLAERVRIAGGRFAAGPAEAPETGFQVRAELPWHSGEAHEAHEAREVDGAVS